MDLMKSDIQVFTTQDGLSARDEDDRLRVVNNHRWARHRVSNLQAVKQEHWRVVHAADDVEVDGMCRIRSCPIDGVLPQRFQFLKNRRAERVESLADSANLGK